MKQALLKCCLCLAPLLLSNTLRAEEAAMDTKSAYQTTQTGLKIHDKTIGTGDQARAGQQVTVHYVGTLENGKQFDSSRSRGQPFSFRLGVGQVIQGWDEGVQGMKVGGVRKLLIPSHLGYGERGIGPIPGNATLVFEVELLGVS